MNVATALNSRYMRYACVMLASLFVNQPDTDIHVYLLHSDLSEEDKKCLQNLAEEYHQTIHFLLIDKNSFSASLPTTAAWSLETYYRLMLTDILPPEVDRLLYLDVDMIINKPVKELYDTDFEGNYFCACKDMPTVFPFPDIRNEIFKEHIAQGFTYFNAGMMLWNIAGLRGKYTFKTYMDLAKALNYQMLAPDQDLLNFLHWNQVKFLDEFQYDLFSRFAYNKGIHYEDVKKETTIVHFAGMKPWEGEFIHYDIEQLWWDYAKLTPFYVELMEEFLYNCINNPAVSDTMFHLSEEKKALRNELDKTSAMCRKLLQLLEH
ncbi:MAG: glycosyltransferase family 8 protein [Clostridium sp.]|nr:glycosyltransferase family 8 protein [Clostridium sp.]